MQKIELNLKNRAMLSHDATMGANASRVERKTAKLAAQCAKVTVWAVSSGSLR